LLLHELEQRRFAVKRQSSPDPWVSGRGPFYLKLGFSSVLAAGAGALIFLYWGLHISDPCPCTGDFCIFGDPATGGADAHLAGGAVGLGMLLGGIGLLIVTGTLVFLFRARVGHPFLSLVVGFPLLYVALLASIWLVARLAWGPTTCT
jgi:hypothetical protein